MVCFGNMNVANKQRQFSIINEATIIVDIVVIGSGRQVNVAGELHTNFID